MSGRRNPQVVLAVSACGRDQFYGRTLLSGIDLSVAVFAWGRHALKIPHDVVGWQYSECSSVTCHSFFSTNLSRPWKLDKLSLFTSRRKVPRKLSQPITNGTTEYVTTAVGERTNREPSHAFIAPATGEMANQERERSQLLRHSNRRSQQTGEKVNGRCT